MSSSTLPRTSRIRRAIVASAVALGIAMGPVAVAAPAQAATAGTIGACFTMNFMGERGPMSFRNVYLDVFWNGQWTYMQTLYTDRGGCIQRYNVIAGYSWRLRVDLYERPYSYSGTSRWATVSTGKYYDLGPVNVLVWRNGL